MSLDTDRLMNNARVHLPGATDAVIQQEFFNVMNDFFQTTNAWQEDITFDVTVNVTDDYEIEQESVSSIVRLLRVVDANSLPVKAIMTEPGSISLKFPPSMNQTYTATVVLTVDDPLPSAGFPVFPAWVLNKYNTGILDGVIGRMMMQPAKPYSNPVMGDRRTKSFAKTMSNAKAEVLHGGLNNGQTWRFPQSFATRRRW